MRQRSLRRLIIFVLALGAFGWLFMWLISKRGDIQLPSDTANLIAALKYTDSGSQTVVIAPDGKITESAGYKPGNADRDLIWGPDGNRIFFISDRKEDTFHIYRWDPQRNSEPEQRSIDKAGRSNLVFDVENPNAKQLSGLLTVRGTVQEFFPIDGRSSQILPPSKQRIAAEDGGGAGNTFELLYGQFGTSFRIAKYFKQRELIAAVVRREENGECLIIQDLKPDEKGNTKPASKIFDAAKIDIQVDAKTGNLVFLVMEVIPPLGQDGKPVKLPFVHGLFMLDPTKAPQEAVAPIFLSPNPKQCVGEIALNPDGSSLMAIGGEYSGNGNFTPAALISCPIQPQGFRAASQLGRGLISNPSFSPDGKKIVYIKREGANRAVFLADADGSSARNLTGTNGDFGTPLFSPQTK